MRPRRSRAEASRIEIPLGDAVIGNRRWDSVVEDESRRECGERR